MDKENTAINPAVEIQQASRLLEEYRSKIALRVVGQREMIDGLLIAMISGGHALLEGVPGLAKTLAIKTIAELSGLSFKRIQFTPDLLPADLTGTLIWEQSKSMFSVRKGPVFANVVLADEINRAPAKVQSALLEAMEERQVTIGEDTYPLPNPFFVLATQNPIEHEGTYALPEAELDRFLIKIRVSYPSREDEGRIVRKLAPFMAEESKAVALPVLAPQILDSLRQAAESIRIDDPIVDYLVSVVTATRPNPDRKKLRSDDLYRYLSFGASPRASLALHRCARIRALFEGRSYVLPEDVKAMAPGVLRHRLVLTYEAEADGLNSDDVIDRILAFVPVP